MRLSKLESLFLEAKLTILGAIKVGAYVAISLRINLPLGLKWQLRSFASRTTSVF